MLASPLPQPGQRAFLDHLQTLHPNEGFVLRRRGRRIPAFEQPRRLSMPQPGDAISLTRVHSLVILGARSGNDVTSTRIRRCVETMGLFCGSASGSNS